MKLKGKFATNSVLITFEDVDFVHGDIEFEAHPVNLRGAGEKLKTCVAEATGAHDEFGIGILAVY